VLNVHVLLTIIGTLGSFFVVPLNALLQECRKRLVGAGNAIVVQNLGKNAAMLLGLELYSLVVKWNVPLVGVWAVLAWCMRGLSLRFGCRNAMRSNEIKHIPYR